MIRRYRRHLFLGLTVLTAACAARAAFVTPTTSEEYFLAGYHPYWTGDAWRDYPTDVLTELFFFELEVDASGGFLDRHGWPVAWRAMTDSALAAGVQVTPTVSMHDPDGFERLFQDSAAIERLLDGVSALTTETPGLSGIHLDLEVFQPVAPEARAGFSAFVAELDSALARIDDRLVLSTFALAYDTDDVYDEEALAASVDYLVVQGYDFHSIGSDRAGPVAPVTGWGSLNWGFVVDRFQSLGVPARKIVMAVPMYGYQWPTTSEQPGAETRGDAVIVPLLAPEGVLPASPRALEQALRHPVSRGPEGTPFYAFRDDDGWHQGWFEDERSLREKFDFVRRRGLGGVAIFPLAYGDERHWQLLRDAFPR